MNPKYYTRMSCSVYIINCPPFWLKTPPLSLVYLKAFLQSKGVKTMVNDLNNKIFSLSRISPGTWLKLDEDFEKNLFRESLKKHTVFFKKLIMEIGNFDCIGLSILKRNTHFSLSLAQEIRAAYPKKQIIIGGPQAFILDKQSSLNKEYSWVIGEGELAFLEIANGVKNRIHRFMETECLDDLPFYDFASFDLNSYSHTLPLLSSRGCPNQCSFCSERLLYKKFRFHSPGYLVEQIIQLKKKSRTNNFVFMDSLINYNEDWLYEFCSSLLKKDLRINWEAQMRIKKKLPLELAGLLKKSGCFNLFIGLESGCDKILKAMNKGFSLQEAVAFFKVLKKAGLNFEVSLILGYPEEGKEEFKETKKFIVKNKEIIPKIAQVNPFTDYLGRFPEKKYPAAEGINRVKKILKVLEKERIKHTKKYINNLIY